MSSVQQNIENLSLKLSEVLTDIGLNNDMIMKRRTHCLFNEEICALDSLLTDQDTSIYHFGSQSEGTTTLGIQSDFDLLHCLNFCHVVPDWAEWKHGVTNVLMVQDETTAGGYCLLQRLRGDLPLPANNVPDEVYCMDDKQRVLLKNSAFDDDFRHIGVVRHGPAAYIPAGQHRAEHDIVLALRCAHWPTEGRRWLNRRSRSGWPSVRLKSECETSGCFFVPVGSKVSGMDDLEWRISTSIAERHLMFSLNVTQMRCYVLMKFLLKSYNVFHNVISSYMCKTALFHCIENTRSDFWYEPNLVLCLNQILRLLYNFVYYMNCPHFIIPENNLMAERISAEQRCNLLSVLQDIIKSNGMVFFEIRIDDFGERLRMKFNSIRGLPIRSAVGIREEISGELCILSAYATVEHYWVTVLQNNCNLQMSIQTLLRMYNICNQQYQSFNCLGQKACSYIAPLLCSAIGSLLASYHVALNIPLSDSVMAWLKLGVTSDVSSGWLKFATVCYSVGDINQTDAILRHVDQLYDRRIVMPMCGCKSHRCVLTQGFCNAASQIQGTEFRHILSHCVIFMRCEQNIVPQEMIQESFRSTPEDQQCRSTFDGWMDLAVVDSLPYLYFLQYKTYQRLQNREEQVRALHNLQQVIQDEPNLSHRETARNLLGQCMEQENLLNDAFLCYERSLQVRPRNNAANFHMSKLLDR